jgi:dTMP kinase
MRTDRGLFITLEGGEGAGKSTQSIRIRAWLERLGRPVVAARQPGGTPLSENLRRLLLDRDDVAIAPLTELLLLFADRAQFVSEVVRPALERGEVVLCDRFTDSTYAYQGGGRGISDDGIATLEKLVHGDRQPDLTLLLDIPAEQGLARIAGRGEANRLEREALDFYQRVRERYLARARREPGRIAVIDASGDPDTVWAAIKNTLEDRLDSLLKTGGAP